MLGKLTSFRVPERTQHPERKHEFCSKMGEPKYRFDILKDLIFSRASFY